MGSAGRISKLDSGMTVLLDVGADGWDAGQRADGIGVDLDAELFSSSIITSMWPIESHWGRSPKASSGCDLLRRHVQRFGQGRLHLVGRECCVDHPYDSMLILDGVYASC